MSAENSPSRRWQQKHRLLPVYTEKGVTLGPRLFPGMEETRKKIEALDNDPEASERARGMEKSILQEAHAYIEALKAAQIVTPVEE